MCVCACVSVCECGMCMHACVCGCMCVHVCVRVGACGCMCACVRACTHCKELTMTKLSMFEYKNKPLTIFPESCTHCANAQKLFCDLSKTHLTDKSDSLQVM